MGNRWKAWGTIRKNASGTSLRVQPVNFDSPDAIPCVSIKAIEDVIAGRKKFATVVILHKPRYKVSYYVKEK